MGTQGGTRAVRIAVTCALGGVLLSGCLAQQADVKQVHQRVSETSAKLRSEITELREADLSRAGWMRTRTTSPHWEAAWTIWSIGRQASKS